MLLLDEPFGALDAKVRDDLRKWLRRLHEEVGVTTVLVTHDQREALDVSDRIAVLNKGRIEQVGSPRTTCTIARRTSSSHRFWGQTVRLGMESWCAARHPHRTQPRTGAPGRRRRARHRHHQATVDRVVHLGFETRVELTSLASGEEFAAQITRSDANALNLVTGEQIYARATKVPALTAV